MNEYLKHDISTINFSDNLNIILCPIPFSYTACAALFIPAGSRDEKMHQHGIAHCIEHMIFKGSEKYSSKQINYLIEGSGGCLNAYTSEEVTCYHLQTLPKSLENSLEILINCVLNPSFREEDLEKEKSVILEEILSNEDQPLQLLQDLYSETIWGSNSLSRSILGTEDSVNSFTRQDLLDFFNQYYLDNKLTLVITGNFDSFKLLEFLKKNWPARTVTSQKRDPAEFICHALKIQKKKLEQVHIQIGIPLPFDDAYSNKFLGPIMNTILGEGTQSRLYHHLREEKGLVYQINSDFMSLSDICQLAIQLICEPSKVEQCLDSVKYVIGTLINQCLDDDELERCKQYLIGTFLQEIESPLGLALWIGENALQKGLINPDQYLDELCKVKKETLEENFKLFFKPNLWSFAFLGSCSHAKKITNTFWSKP